MEMQTAQEATAAEGLYEYCVDGTQKLMAGSSDDLRRDKVVFINGILVPSAVAATAAPAAAVLDLRFCCHALRP